MKTRKFIIVMIGLFSVYFSSCTKDALEDIKQRIEDFEGGNDDDDGNVPPIDDTVSTNCLEEKIGIFEGECSKMNCVGSATVKEYEFQNQLVYVFDVGACGADIQSEVIDSECNTIGYLGGIAGNTVINGEDFSGAVYMYTVWEN